MLLTYTLKQVIPKEYTVDFNKLHELVYASIVKTFKLEDRSTWDPIDWINYLGDEFSDFSGYYLDKLLNIEIDEEANDLELDDVSSDFYRFLENLYLESDPNSKL